MSLTMKICCSKKGKIPQKATDGSAGYDLFSAQNADILPNSRAIIETGIQLELPSGYFGQICGRSGLASKNGIMVGGGVIDNDYRGEIKVILFNMSHEVFQVKVGMKIAQLICLPFATLKPVEVECLSESERGGKGFGSSGFF